MENKHSLCPLCGGEPKRFQSLFRLGVYSYGCPDCEFTTFWGAGLEWSAWEALVSKFPPISRLQLGDELMICNGDIITVEWISPEKDYFYNTESSTSWDSSDVLLWPWELKEKGGEQ